MAKGTIQELELEVYRNCHEGIFRTLGADKYAQEYNNIAFSSRNYLWLYREVLSEYVTKYGFERVNKFALSCAKRMEKKKPREKVRIIKCEDDDELMFANTDELDVLVDDSKSILDDLLEVKARHE